MPTLHAKTQISSDELLQAIDRLDPADLERFVSRVLMLRARRLAPSVPPEEAALLLRLNRGMPAGMRAHLERLNVKSEDGEFTLEEHTELLGLVARIEALEVERIEILSRLAHLRGVSLTVLMDELGIRSPKNG